MQRKLTFFSFLFFLSYSILAQIPAGYYTAAEGKNGAALKTQLSSIISAGAVDKGYDGLYNIYKTSDVLPNGKVWDMYSIKADGTANYFYSHSSGDQCGSYSAEGACYNREHSFCDSWLGAQSPQRSDAHHIVPTDGYVNNRRSSFPHGKVGSASWTSSNGSKLGSSDPSTGYSGTVFEPIDEFKGDFARMYFYVVTRYESKVAGWAGNGTAGEILAGNTYPAFKTWFYTLMLQWNAQDPVSQKEITRNNAVAALQKNRNPFIDHPELADYIWGAKKDQPWSESGTTYPALTSPVSGSSIDFGKIAYLQTAGATLQIKGANLTGGLTFAVSGTNAANFSVATTTITKEQAEAGYTLTVNFSAQSIGDQTANLTISGGGITSTSVNLKASSSDGFLALPASSITSTGFVANWTSSANATGYLLDVFSIQTSGNTQTQTLLDEEFTSGLPSTWTSSGYSDKTSLAGNMRLASSNDQGTIITPSLNLVNPVTLLVRASQYKSDNGAVLTATVDNQALTTWTTSNVNQDFTINIPAKTATSTISLSAAKGARVYVDYVKVTSQAATQTQVSVSGYPASVGNVLTSPVSALQPNTTYYYTVTPQGNTATASNKIQLTTALSSPVVNQEMNALTWVVLSDGMLLRNLPADCKLIVSDALGRKIQQLAHPASEIQLKLGTKGLYFLQVQKGQQVNTFKILF